MSTAFEGIRMRKKIQAYSSGLEKQLFSLLQDAANSNNIGNGNGNRSAKSQFNKKCILFNLSGRQIDVLELVFQRLTSKEIGTKLNIGSKAVEYHLANIYKKCSVNTKIELFELFQR